MNISRRALATPFVVRAASLDFIPRADWDGVYRLIDRHLSGMGWMNFPPGTQRVYMSRCTVHLPPRADRPFAMLRDMCPAHSTGNTFWSDS